MGAWWRGVEGAGAIPPTGLPYPQTALNWQMLLRIACKKGLVLVRLRTIEPNAPQACLCPGHAVSLAE
jgi:hypothetical protein